MPRYDYQCSGSKCGHWFEADVPYEHRDNVCCPKCARKGTRQFSPPGLIFKGGGWTTRYH